MPTDANPSRQTPPPAPTGSAPGGAQRPWYRPSGRWIAFFVVLLALNFFLSSRAMEPRSRVRVPYSPLFLQQVKAGNVAEITSKGTDIQGTFEKSVTLQGLEADDAVPDRDPRLCQHRRALPGAAGERRHGQRRAARHRGSLVADAALRLRTDDPLHRAALLAVPSGGEYAERARLLRTLPGASLRALGRQGDVRGRRRHRRGEGRVERGRRLPAPPRQVRPPRRPDPSRRSPLRPPRDRQDTARARGRRRGERSLLLDGRVRVRRSDRRRRRRASAGPVQGGEDERSCDRVHRRAGRDRPLADEWHCRLQRRQRRARADAEPDPDRDGRIRFLDQRHRHRRHEPTGRSRPGASSPRAVRPPRRRPAARPRGSRGDPSRAYARRPARLRRRSRPDRGHDAGHGRSRSRQPRQRGCAHRRAARATTWSRRRTSPTLWNGSCSAPSGR